MIGVGKNGDCLPSPRLKKGRNWGPVTSGVFTNFMLVRSITPTLTSMKLSVLSAAGILVLFRLNFECARTNKCRRLSLRGGCVGGSSVVPCHRIL